MAESMLYSLLGFIIIAVVFFLIIMWKVFVKAGLDGWKCLIPFYNAYLYITHVLGMSKGWFIIMLIPGLSIFTYLMIVYYSPFRLAKRFGQGVGFGFGLFFLPMVFYPILAFGASEFILNVATLNTDDFGVKEVDQNHE